MCIFFDKITNYAYICLLFWLKNLPVAGFYDCNFEVEQLVVSVPSKLHNLILWNMEVFRAKVSKNGIW